MKIKKSLKGFTLIELILSMALFAVLMVMVLFIFKPIAALSDNTKQYTGDRTVLEQSGKFVTERLKFATKAYIYNNCKPKTTLILTADQPKYTLIKLSNTEKDTWNGKDYTGRMLIQRTYNSSIIPSDRVLGKAFYGREYYTYSVSFPKDSSNNNILNAPIISVTSYEKTNNGAKGNKLYTADIAANMVNTTVTLVNDGDPDSGGTETGSIYILYMLP